MTEPKPPTAAKPAAVPARERQTTPAVQFEKLTDIDLALLTATAQGWRPEPGDEIRGRVLAVKIGTSDVGGIVREYPIVFILPDGADGDTSAIAVHAFHAVLLNELRSARPEFGDKIFIRSLGDLGREAPKGMNAPEVYAVHVTKPKGADKTSPWDILGRPE